MPGQDFLQSVVKLIKEGDRMQIPEPVTEITKLHILDSLGVALYGSKSNLFKRIETLFPIHKANKGTATIIGNGLNSSIQDASFLNSLCINESNFEDGHRFAGLHPAASVIPAALSLSQTLHLSGIELIRSVIIGYEVICHLGSAINPSHLARGFHTTSTLAPFGSATVACLLYRLDEEKIINSLGLAASFSSGLMASFSTDARPIQVARGCQSGLFATELAKKNVSGSPKAMEGPEGFLPAFVGKGYDKILKPIERFDYQIQKTYIKLHGGCRHLHAAIDCINDLVEKEKIEVGEIREIKIQVYPVAIDFVGVINPKTGKEAEFSLPFAVALALVQKEVRPEDFVDSKLEDDKIKRLMKIVTIETDDVLGAEYPRKRAVITNILTKNGNKFSNKLDYAKGEPENPASTEEIYRKFVYLSKKVLPTKIISKIQDSVMKLDEIEDVNEFMKLFSQKNRASRRFIKC
jgi:2-methylcitrate dehydratase PrpD